MQDSVIAALTLGFGLITSVWRGGSKVGKLTQKVDNLATSSERRLTELEDHVYEHDQWHLNQVKYQPQQRGQRRGR